MTRPYYSQRAVVASPPSAFSLRYRLDGVHYTLRFDSSDLCYQEVQEVLVHWLLLEVLLGLSVPGVQTAQVDQKVLDILVSQ